MGARPSTIVLAVVFGLAVACSAASSPTGTADGAPSGLGGTPTGDEAGTVDDVDGAASDSAPLDGAMVDGGVGDSATTDGAASGVATCTYRRWLTHSTLCDEKCPNLPPDEMQVVTNVPLTVFTDGYLPGICRSYPIGGKRRIKVGVPSHFIAMTANEARFTFQLAGAPPLEQTTIYSTNYCVAGLDTTMSGTIKVVNGNEATLDFYVDASPWFGTLCDYYALHHSCVRVRIECKGSGIATAL